MKSLFLESKKIINIFKIKNISCFLFLFCFVFVNLESVYAQTIPRDLTCYTYAGKIVDADGLTIEPKNTQRCKLPLIVFAGVAPKATYNCYIKLGGNIYNLAKLPEVEETINKSLCLTVIEESKQTIEEAKNKANLTNPAPAVKEVDCGKKDNYNCYTLLEPLGPGGESNTTENVTIANGELSKYLQEIITYLLMLVAVAAVFYMIYGGILYVTTDIINKKAEGKEMIQRVTYGLIFVFTVWLLINSINPNILKNSLNFSLKIIGIDLASTTPPTTTTQAPGSTVVAPTVIPAGACVTGLGTVEGSHQLCKDGGLVEQAQKMLAAARAAGINLQISSAYRSANSNTLTSGAAAANGMSNHQRGKAIDFNGGFKCYPAGPVSKEYVWLKASASTYGFYNLLGGMNDDACPSGKGEYNHWSTTGR